MTEAPHSRLIIVHGLPVPGAEEFYSKTGSKLAGDFGEIVNFTPNYAGGNLFDEQVRLGHVIHGALEEGRPVAILAPSAAAPIAVSTLSQYEVTDPITIAAISGRLNTLDRDGFRSVAEIREKVSPLYADAITSVGSLSHGLRGNVASFRVVTGDDRVHPDTSYLQGAVNINTGY